MGVKKADKRIIGELRVEVKEKYKKKKLLRSRLKWAGHVEIMGDDNLVDKSDAQKVD